ncbi:hypothetical protein HHK36_015296 [Tetracentron sinense]|uniref:DUF4005 domain-containing protein n=1 Tax=Tetracentron sinense TaxID=13715 RepID=A0A834Z5V8_TETSI|nr:hypothetical protein HHK36_015296 [Tetracentron sinense]
MMEGSNASSSATACLFMISEHLLFVSVFWISSGTVDIGFRRSNLPRCFPGYHLGRCGMIEAGLEIWVVCFDFGIPAMGKSPGKWIKSVLFGKKASKSNLSKGRVVSDYLLIDQAVKLSLESGFAFRTTFFDVLEKDASYLYHFVLHVTTYASLVLAVGFLILAKSENFISTIRKHSLLKAAANEKEVWIAAGAPAAVDPPLISHPTPGTTDRGGNSELENGLASSLPCDGVVLLSVNQNADTQGTTGLRSPNDPERIRQEQAATKAQAAFRGYLARRAFRALRGIIRLQALVRGHLVRRQAVATLRCMQGIVKLQALVRGRSVRFSDTGLEVHKKGSLGRPLDAKHSDSLGVNTSTRTDSLGVNTSTRTEKLLANVFVSKLLASSPTAMPLRLRYGQEEPNSAWKWLECWTMSRFWEPLSQPKKVLDSKSQRKRGVEAEPGRPKRSVRSVPAANVDNGSLHSTSKSEKPKRNLRKSSSHPVDSVQEHPQNELEKVKRNLRKVSNSTTEASDPPEVETEKPKSSLRKTSASPAPDALEQGTSDPSEKKKDPTVVISKQPDVETIPKPMAADEPVDVLHDDHSTVELQYLENSGKDDNSPVTNGVLCSKEDQTSNGNQKTSKRRASFPAKQEYTGNDVQNTPTLPSYMASTESAKARLRGQGSPRFSQDGAEKNGFTRRHSLPSSTNGKLSSPTPQTQRLVQASGKCGIRSDRSLLSSNEKVVQAEWRR